MSTYSFKNTEHIFLGPWARYEDEQAVAIPDPETQKEMDEFVRKRKLKSRAGRKALQDEEQLVEETSTLHRKLFSSITFSECLFQSKRKLIMMVAHLWRCPSTQASICDLSTHQIAAFRQLNLFTHIRVTQRPSMQCDGFPTPLTCSSLALWTARCVHESRTHFNLVV